MIARLRPSVRDEPRRQPRATPRPPPAESADKPKSPAEFVNLGREILSHPPLRHRGDRPEAGLSVYEFCLGMGAILLALTDRAAEQHRSAIRTGKRAMARKRSSEQPVYDMDFGSPREQFEVEGNAGFDRGRRRFQDDNRDRHWRFETSRSELLRYAGLNRKAEYIRRVYDALDRLTQPCGYPSVLFRWRKRDDQRLELTVGNEWLWWRKRFNRVRLPLPTSGPVVLALYLFLSMIDPTPSSHTSISAKKLYAQLGIRRGRPAHDERALRYALERVNKHRRKSGLSAFDLEKTRSGEWRFTERTKQKPGERIAEEQAETQKAADVAEQADHNDDERPPWLDDIDDGPSDEELEDERLHQMR